MYNQQLPGFTRVFESAPWMVRESDHYRFHFFDGSLAHREIDHIVTTQEGAFGQVLAFLNLSAPKKRIKYYLYPDVETKVRLMGSPWFAQSVYDDFAIHALYTEKDRVIGPHEDTHLLSLPLGLSIGFLQEGLAERMVDHDWYGDSFQQAVHEVQRDAGFTLSPDLLTTHQAWLDTKDEYARHYYALAALFADYLMGMYGKEKYLKLYSALKRDASLEKNRVQFASILSDEAKVIWERFLAQLNCDKNGSSLRQIQNH